MLLLRNHSRKFFCGTLLVLFSMPCLAQDNLLTNPGFDSNLSGWRQFFGQSAEWSSDNANGSGGSGSAFVGNKGQHNGVAPLVLHQCVPVQPGQEYEFGGDVRVPVDQPPSTTAYIFVYTFASEDCSGDSFDFESTTGFSLTGDWVGSSSSIVTGPNIQTIRVTVGIFKPTAETDDAAAYFDNLFLIGPDGDDIVVTPSISASWFNPAESGHGISIDLMDAETAWMCWFTFDLDGNQAWICGIGSIAGDTITFDAAFQIEGGAFPPNFDPGNINEVPWGAITVKVIGCDAGTMTWTTSAPGFESGSMPIARLTDLWGVPCNQ